MRALVPALLFVAGLVWPKLVSTPWRRASRTVRTVWLLVEIVVIVLLVVNFYQYPYHFCSFGVGCAIGIWLFQMRDRSRERSVTTA